MYRWAYVVHLHSIRFGTALLTFRAFCHCATLRAMPRQTPEEQIAALEQKRAQIQNRLSRLRSVESTKARKLDTRRKILAGACILALGERDADEAKRLRGLLDEFLKMDRERALFSLAPRPKPPAPSSDTTAPQTPSVEGWKPSKLGQGQWGAKLGGEQLAAIPESDQLPGTPIRVTDRHGEAWNTTIKAVVNRSDAEIVVTTTTGRPRPTSPDASGPS